MVQILNRKQEISQQLACYAVVDFIRSMIQECYPGLVENLRKAIEEEGDGEVCLHCAEGLTQIPVIELIKLIQMRILKAKPGEDCAFVQVQDLLKLVDPEVDFELPGDRQQ